MPATRAGCQWTMLSPEVRVFPFFIRSLGSRPRALSERAGHLAHELGEGPCQGRSAGDEAETDSLRRQEAPLPPIRLTESPPRSVPDDATPKPATYGEAHGAWTGLPHREQHERRALHAGPTPEQPIELRPGPQPFSPREHRAEGRRPGHVANRIVGAALWRADASAPFGRLWSPSARGTRASWPAGDDSVGTSASRLPPRGCYAHSPPILQMAW
jgi:hypothetical protein